MVGLIGSLRGSKNLSDFLNPNNTTGSLDGDFTIATFNRPHGMVITPNDDIYVVEYDGNKIRKMSLSNRVVTTIAGLTGDVVSPIGNIDSNVYYDARFNKPVGIAYHVPTGDVYVSDHLNYSIRKITPAGVVSTLVSGNGLKDPHYLIFDSNNNLFCANLLNYTIQKINLNGTMSVFAGTLGSAGTDDGTGAAARFNLPHGITIDENDNLYVTDYGSGKIRKITPAGVVTTLLTELLYPRGIVYHPPSSTFIVAEYGKNRYLRVTMAGVYTVIATSIQIPTGVCIDSNNNLYCNEGNKVRILKL